MKIIHNLTESLSDDFAHAEEQQLSVSAKVSCFNIAQEAILLHKLLNYVILEDKDQWVVERLAKVHETLCSLKQYTQNEVGSTESPDSLAFEDASGGASSAGDVAAVATPLMKNPVKRKMREAAPVGTTGTTPTTSNITAGGSATPAKNPAQPNTAQPAGTTATQGQAPKPGTTGATPAANPAQDAQNKANIANNLRKAGNAQLANKLASNSASNKFDQNEIAAITAASATK
ncbi:hypothetical protein UFOVP116_390 [uncultured Caudovirales phage]|uniref:Uncharacterized protein n=1 Tax=uncultured Caudovirales phage TaxID=2100421 RepID=A0A6J5LBQ9_9CAUD|nr:hypothetical protein UFOVP116_390 [uncultured Caudovirales phage]